MTGRDMRQAMNQRRNTANLHLERERKPTSLKGWTTTMYLQVLLYRNKAFENYTYQLSLEVYSSKYE